ncbi:MAG: LysR family transcriptional regulator, partial [Alphaproteobacteria bacterium]|nr:LysR family transcriptional regulator [Alphaproteobacteria bacterium]
MRPDRAVAHQARNHYERLPRRHRRSPVSGTVDPASDPNPRTASAIAELEVYDRFHHSLACLEKGMDVRSLRSFLRVAETGNLSRAAEALHIVQPALSRQIALLEAELGTQLLVRHRRGVTLTEAGIALREHAQGILAGVDAARQAVSALGGEPTGTVALGLPTSMLYVLSGALVEGYRRRYPRVALRLHEAIGHVIEALMEDGRLDVAVIIEPRAIRGVAQETLVSEAMCLAGPPAAGLDMARPVSAADVANVPMMMFSPQ